MQQFRKPQDITVEVDKKTNLSCRIKTSTKEKLVEMAGKTPARLPLAVFVEQVLEDYVKFVERANSKPGKAN